MPKLVDLFVIRTLTFPVLFRRNNCLHALTCSIFYDLIRVISFISQQILSIYTIDELASLSAICCGTVCNKYSDRHTMRIHGQVYLSVEPPFERLMC